jgi:carboxymethylenebutenolidase
MLDIATADGIADAYLALPENELRGGVLFFVDVFGLRKRTKEMARRIAAEGYAVLVPNVFFRAGRAPVAKMPSSTSGKGREEFMDTMRPLMGELTAEAMSRDGAAYLEQLAETVPGPFGITGYCMGGRLGWRVAAAFPERISSLGCFHTGGLVTADEDSPHRSAGELDSELYFGFADEDASMTAEQIAALERSLEEAGASYRAEVYAGAHHGYTMSDTAVFDEAACERHFRELFALLDRSLVPD